MVIDILFSGRKDGLLLLAFLAFYFGIPKRPHATADRSGLVSSPRGGSGSGHGPLHTSHVRLSGGSPTLVEGLKQLRRRNVKRPRHEDETPHANVHQEVSRFREIDGVVRKVETSVVQRETWVKQNGEWKLQFVDDERDQKTLVDGKLIVR